MESMDTIFEFDNLIVLFEWTKTYWAFDALVLRIAGLNYKAALRFEQF